MAYIRQNKIVGIIPCVQKAILQKMVRCKRNKSSTLVPRRVHKITNACAPRHTAHTRREDRTKDRPIPTDVSEIPRRKWLFDSIRSHPIPFRAIPLISLFHFNFPKPTLFPRLKERSLGRYLEVSGIIWRYMQAYIQFSIWLHGEVCMMTVEDRTKDGTKIEKTRRWPASGHQKSTCCDLSQLGETVVSPHSI